MISFTGEPLTRVSLRLVTPRAPLGSPTETPIVSDLSAETDLQGNFHFDEVEPGRYMLTAVRSRYLGAQYMTARGNVLTITPGQTLTGIVIKMTPQSIIAGRVVDDEGEAIPGLNVSVRLSLTSGRPQGFAPPPATGTTDADGAFSIGSLNPGKYVVSVAAPPNASRDTPAPGVLKEAYVTTYYPDVIDGADATPVDVGAGAQVRGLEIRLQKVSIFQVKGKVVVAATGEAGSPDVVNLIRRGSTTPGLTARVASVRGGEFSFEGVLPGDYMLETKPTPGNEGRRSLVGWEPISVGRSDVDRVVVGMKPGIELSGRVVVEGTPVSDWPQITLTPLDGLNYMDFPMIGPDGRFTLTGLEPARYHVTVAGVPAPMFVKAVRFNGLSLTGEIDLASAPAGSLEVVIAYGTSSISGVVNDISGPVGPGVDIMVAPGGPLPARVTQTDENGRFALTGLPPGEYFLMAMDLGPGMLPPEWIEKMGKAVTVGESDAVAADLRLSTADDLPRN